MDEWEGEGAFRGRDLRVLRQSIAENTMFRFKALFGGRLWARSLATQHIEALVKCSVLNRMTQLGMPETLRMG
jgi:hypothetical protein